MEIYKKMYLHLFSKTCDAIQQLEQHNIGISKDILICASLECEQMFMTENEKIIKAIDKKDKS